MPWSSNLSLYSFICCKIFCDPNLPLFLFTPLPLRLSTSSVVNHCRAGFNPSTKHHPHRDTQKVMSYKIENDSPHLLYRRFTLLFWTEKVGFESSLFARVCIQMRGVVAPGVPEADWQALSHTHPLSHTPFSGSAAKRSLCLYLPLVTPSFLSFIHCSRLCFRTLSLYRSHDSPLDPDADIRFFKGERERRGVGKRLVEFTVSYANCFSVGTNYLLCTWLKLASEVGL